MEISATLVLVLLALFTFLQNVANGFDSWPQTNAINPFKYRVPENPPYRTSYHFQPPQNWMNDPNGPMYYKGVYHLFYQHNPTAATFGDGIVWGHSVSYDLINWIHLNNAIEPSEAYDIISCWSGSATILLDGKPVIMYTGIDHNRHQVQNLAMPKNLSDPFLREWVKHTQNPVIIPSEVAEVDNFRDPSTAWYGKDGKWRIIIGAQKGDQGRAILYQSEDFVNWKLEDANPFYATDNTGVCECPDFYPVSINGTNGVDSSVESSSVRHVAKVGYLRMAHDYYFVGKYLSDEERFIADAKFTGTSLDLRYDYGKFYASKSFFDYAKNRRILWGWVNESDSEKDDIDKGWAGVQSIPRQVWLDNKSGNRLVQWPIKEVEKLRSKNISINGEKLRGGSILEVSGITASQADIEVLFEIPELENAESFDLSDVDPQLLCSNAPRSGIIGPFGLLALASKDLREHTAISFRVYKTSNKFVGLMCSDQSRSSLQNGLDKTTYGTFFDVDSNLRTISLRSLIDHSIIESFGEGGRVCISSRVYPKLATGNEAHLYVFNNGTMSILISKLNAWCMKEAEIGHVKNMSYKTC
ncbi:beta-fructofuranosidase, insoluble isoenzyme CWINV6-like isoform X1 [Arachis stenosperma]|uniref:beta-fructofuranosidase, insoluble isoenzyme CWINV6-like isoform X1 n=2 Tax=Arachis stenosperma TaxID=217475 RepID=UPI0025AC56B2|nr:beta-fructofuranosidase, insoluble isoenzyme CWINV6-like isoform X1 [Arachis stenosperma]